MVVGGVVVEAGNDGSLVKGGDGGVDGGDSDDSGVEGGDGGVAGGCGDGGTVMVIVVVGGVVMMADLVMTMSCEKPRLDGLALAFPQGSRAKARMKPLSRPG